jgi:hypothetical protein
MGEDNTFFTKKAGVRVWGDPTQSTPGALRPVSPAVHAARARKMLVGTFSSNGAFRFAIGTHRSDDLARKILWYCPCKTQQIRVY